MSDRSIELPPCVESLFQFTRSNVTDQDIADFSPNDPGYPNYVDLWTEIRHSGQIPRNAEFDLSEVIGLTGWGIAEKARDPGRFRNYRRFTAAVGIALLHYGNDSDMVRPSNYLARDLIIDVDASGDHLKLVRAVMMPTRDLLRDAPCEEGYPFFTFGEMVLAQLAGDWSASELAAVELIRDEQAVRDDEDLNYLCSDARFLFGVSNYDQVLADWIAFSLRLKNPTGHEETQLVIDTLLNQGNEIDG